MTALERIGRVVHVLVWPRLAPALVDVLHGLIGAWP